MRRPEDLRMQSFLAWFYLENRIVKKVTKENHKEVLKAKQSKKITALRPNTYFNFNMYMEQIHVRSNNKAQVNVE